MKPINIKEYSHYLIDTNGNIFSTLSQKGFSWKNGNKQIKTWPNKNTNYHQVVLQNRKAGIKPKCFYVHRLVALTYISNPNNLPEVNHIIPNKNDNSVGNLEWVTTKQNIEHNKLFGVSNKTKMELLLDNTKLINKGLTHYSKHNDINHLCKLWDCSSPIVSNILKKYSVKRENLRYSNEELKKLRQCILDWNKKHYTNAFLKYVKNKTGFETSLYFIRKQIKYLKDLDLNKN